MQVLISEDEIARKVAAMADVLKLRLTPDTLAVLLLDGALCFGHDLLRALFDRGLNLECESLKLSSYQNAYTSSGAVNILSDISRAVVGRQILLIDDVLETGGTLFATRAYLRDRGAGEILSCVFAKKPVEKRKMKADFVCWDAPDKFLVGYGLDDHGRYRGQPFIGAKVS